MKEQSKMKSPLEMKELTKEWMCRKFDAATTLQQLRHPDPFVFGSWGVHNLGCLMNKALAFGVNGHLFKGIVVITLGAMDTYDVHFLTPMKPDAENKKYTGFVVNEEMTLTDIYGDQIQRILDGVIERAA
jgi:hypothetical protein